MKKLLLSKAVPGALVLMGTALTLPVLTPAAHASPRLNGAGATFPYPIYSRWFDAYAKKSGVQINYQAVGSGAGLNQLFNKTVDFGASDAPLGNADLAKTAMPVVQIPTVAGVVSLAYNLPGVSKLKLTAGTLAGIFLGRIKRWNDPQLANINPGIHLPALPINVAHRSDGSGTTYIFTHYLSAISPAWKAKVGAGKSVAWPVGSGGKGNDGVAAIIKTAPGSIGYVELAYARQNHLPSALLRNASGVYLLPSVAGAVAAAAAAAPLTAKDPRSLIVNQKGPNAYPISGYTFIMFPVKVSDSPRRAMVINFLRWAMQSGQSFAAPLYYAPLPRAVVAANEMRLKTLSK